MVTCAVVLEVAGFKMPELPNIGEFDMFDFTDESADGFVQVNDF